MAAIPSTAASSVGWPISDGLVIGRAACFAGRGCASASGSGLREAAKTLAASSAAIEAMPAARLTSTYWLSSSASAAANWLRCALRAPQTLNERHTNSGATSICELMWTPLSRGESCDYQWPMLATCFIEMSFATSPAMRSSNRQRGLRDELAARDKAQSGEGDNGDGDVHGDEQVRREESHRTVIAGHAQRSRGERRGAERESPIGRGERLLHDPWQ